MNTTQITKDQLHAAMTLVIELGRAIKDLGSVPEGHLYAPIMGKVSLEAFQGAIGLLERKGLVSRSSSNLVTWIA